MTLPAAALTRAARAEFVDATAWYEAQRKGLGVEFVAEVDSCLTLAAQHPERFPLTYKKLRRVTVRRFPCVVYFYEQAPQIVVVAVFHSKRDPAIWQGRV